MKESIGFIEYRSIAKGIEASDAMLKSGNVTLIYSTILCPGKYLVMLCGDVGAVETAIRTGSGFDPASYLDSSVIPNIHKSVLPALTGTTPITMHDALGLIETVDICAAIVAADVAAKASQIDLLEIRLARGMGGKGFVSLCGDISAVNAAIDSATREIGRDGMLIASSVIPSPDRQLVI